GCRLIQTFSLSIQLFILFLIRRLIRLFFRFILYFLSRSLSRLRLRFLSGFHILLTSHLFSLGFFGIPFFAFRRSCRLGGLGILGFHFLGLGFCSSGRGLIFAVNSS